MLITFAALIAIIGWFLLGVYITSKKGSTLVNILIGLSFVAIIVAFIK